MAIPKPPCPFAHRSPSGFARSCHRARCAAILPGIPCLPSNCRGRAWSSRCTSRRSECSRARSPDCRMARTSLWPRPARDIRVCRRPRARGSLSESAARPRQLTRPNSDSAQTVRLTAFCRWFDPKRKRIHCDWPAATAYAARLATRHRPRSPFPSHPNPINRAGWFGSTTSACRTSRPAPGCSRNTGCRPGDHRRCTRRWGCRLASKRYPVGHHKCR